MPIQLALALAVGAGGDTYLVEASGTSSPGQNQAKPGQPQRTQTPGARVLVHGTSWSAPTRPLTHSRTHRSGEAREPSKVPQPGSPSGAMLVLPPPGNLPSNPPANTNPGRYEFRPDTADTQTRPPLTPPGGSQLSSKKTCFPAASQPRDSTTQNTHGWRPSKPTLTPPLLLATLEVPPFSSPSQTPQTAPACTAEKVHETGPPPAAWQRQRQTRPFRDLP